jgi:hypothetical protein
MRFKALSLVASLFSIGMIAGCHGSNDRSAVEAKSNQEQSAVSAVPASAWKLDRDVNPVTGVVTFVAYLEFRGEQNLYIRQVGHKLDCYVTTGDFLETSSNVEDRISTVQYKIDGGKLIRQGWWIGDSNENLFYPGNCESFISQLRQAKTLAFEYSPAGKVPSTMVLDISGFPDGFKVEHVEAKKPHSAMVNVARQDHASLPLCKNVIKPDSSDYPTCRTE